MNDAFLLVGREAVNNKLGLIVIVPIDLQNSSDQIMLTYAKTTDYGSTKAHASKTWFQEGEGHFILHKGYP